MKKLFGYGVIFVLSMMFVSAATTNLGFNLGQGMEQLISTVEGLLGPFFSVFLGGTGDLLFERVLFLTIILCIVYLVLKQTSVFKGDDKGKEVIRWVVAVSISLLATRFLSDTNLVQTVILPYSALGVVLTAFLPTIIFFFFVRSFSDSSTLRKTLWIFYGVVYIALWVSRYEDLGSVSWIYFWTAIVSFFFFLFDGTLQAAWIRSRLENESDISKASSVAELREKIKKLDKQFEEGNWGDNKELYKKKRKNLEDQIKIVLGR